MEEHLIKEACAGNRHSLARLLYDNYAMSLRSICERTEKRRFLYE